jgi:hypothetical protein
LQTRAYDINLLYFDQKKVAVFLLLRDIVISKQLTRQSDQYSDRRETVGATEMDVLGANRANAQRIDAHHGSELGRPNGESHAT